VPATSSPNGKTSSRGNPTPAAAANRTRPSRSTKAKRGFATAATAAGPQPGRKNKFNAAGEHIDGIWFASEAEGERYRQLKAMQEAGRIANLKCQVLFPLTVNNRVICGYRCDFTYDEMNERGELIRPVIEDVKGMETPEFKIKAKLFDALQPTPLSIIHVLGSALHSSRPKLSDKTSKPIRSRAGWIDLHWKNRIPN
jgi:hypothetical protein